jgi:uncharacterized membrane protein (DUF485 family)
VSAQAAQARTRRALGFTAVLLVLVGGLVLLTGYARAFCAYQPIPGVSVIILLALLVDAAAVILAVVYARLAGADARPGAAKGET